MKKARTLQDVIKIMYKYDFDFDFEQKITISVTGVKRTLLRFSNMHGNHNPNLDMQKVIGNNFNVERYADGKVYHIFRRAY